MAVLTDWVKATPAQLRYIRNLVDRAEDTKGFQPHDLVKAAEPSDSPIHDLLTWDNRRAAHLYRLRQAARLLRAYTGWVIRSDKKTLTLSGGPIMVLASTGEGEKAKYLKTSYALDNEYTRKDLIARRISFIRGAIKQLLIVPELIDLHDQLAEVIAKYKIPAKGSVTAKPAPIVSARESAKNVKIDNQQKRGRLAK